MPSNEAKQNIKVELLAPAGSKESFYAAIGAGADAVYMAASKFGARAYADNFSEEDIFECSDVAHIYGKKIYLTVNTLLKEDEFGELGEMLKSGIFDACDGLIIQDLGVADFIKKEAPHIPLHASTQMSVTGPNAAAFLSDFGFTRIVPAREISLEQIKEIHDKTGIEIECFIHGSMCYSYSGQCLFSSILGSRSGNRGRCAQPCRLPYAIKGGDGSYNYPLSLKDMCTLEILPQIIDAGAVSLKVEGRMKTPSYVSGVISIYRKYLDLICSGEKYRVEKKDLQFLSSLYVRDSFSTGYYFQNNSKDMITLGSHGYNQDKNNSDNDDSTDIATAIKDIRKIKVSFKAAFISGKNAVIIASATDLKGRKQYADISGCIVEEAKKSAIKREDIAKSLKKLGNTVFKTDDSLIDISMDENAFYSLKGINELRRKVLDDLKNKIKNPSTINSGSYSCKIENFCKKYYYKNVTNPENIENSLLLSNLKQARALAYLYENEGIKNLKKVYLSEDILDIDALDVLDPLKKDIDFYAALSFVRTKKPIPGLIIELLKQKKLTGVLVRNHEDLSYLASSDIRKEIYLISDFGLYAFNSHSAGIYDKICDRVTIPLEMSYNEEKALKENTGMVFEKVIYGYAPLMITANCIRKTLKKCSRSGGFEALTDRKNTEFPVKMCCGECLNIIYNSVPLLLKKQNEKNNFRVELSIEDYDTSLEILRYYFGDGSYPDMPHTTGWQTRPVL